MAKNNGNGLGSKILLGLVSILAAVGLALSGFALRFNFEAHAAHATVDERLATMQAAIEALAANTTADVKQDATLAKHWKIHSATRTAIQRLWNEHQLGVWEWPELGE